jgi:uncharacterized protein
VTGYDRLADTLRPAQKLAIACSGGVDSTLLTKVACDVLGRDNVVALHAHGPMHVQEELDNVQSVVSEIGCHLQVIDYNPLLLDGFKSNPRDRCYHCKKKIYSLFLNWASENGFSALADGTNLDDLDDHRPGLKALEEHCVFLPLVEAGLNKKEIRRMSKELGLSNWDRLSASCLATRIPAGREITLELLGRVAFCERFLHKHGFLGCRVRLIDDNTVYIEILEKDFPQVADKSNRKKISDFFLSIGLGKVFIDITGR